MSERTRSRPVYQERQRSISSLAVTLFLLLTVTTVNPALAQSGSDVLEKQAESVGTPVTMEEVDARIRSFVLRTAIMSVGTAAVGGAAMVFADLAPYASKADRVALNRFGMRVIKAGAGGLWFAIALEALAPFSAEAHTGPNTVEAWAHLGDHRQGQNGVAWDAIYQKPIETLKSLDEQAAFLFERGNVVYANYFEHRILFNRALIAKASNRIRYIESLEGGPEEGNGPIRKALHRAEMGKKWSAKDLAEVEDLKRTIAEAEATFPIIWAHYLQLEERGLIDELAMLTPDQIDSDDPTDYFLYIGEG